MSDVRIITEPSVYLVGKQVVQDEGLNRLLDDHDFSNWSTDSPCDAETLVEVAARTCYQSFKGGRPHADHLRHLLEVGHGSCVEHAVWNFVITGVSRSLTHELVRHRSGMSYSQLSQRYVDESVAEYVEPDVIAGDPELHAIWLDAVSHAHAAYVELAEKLAAKGLPCPGCNGRGEVVFSGINDPYPCGECRYSGKSQDKTAVRKAARQAARSVLPNATETKIFVTANARALRHFLEQRGSRHAEPEIRKLAGKMLDVLRVESPNLFGDYTKEPLPDGTFDLHTPYRKV